MIAVVAPDGFKRPAKILQDLLGARGPREAVVNYGYRHVGGWDFPVLNGQAGLINKLEQGQQLHAKGVPTVRHLTNTEALRQAGNHVFFGRKHNHFGGKDIMIALSNTEVQDRIHAGADFFTIYEPSLEEMRLWIYRGRHLASYKKVLQYPAKYKKVGRNYGNGWAQDLMHQAEVDRHRGAIVVASLALDALGLDFGAVDLLVTGNNHRPYVVLEVNSAPGVEGPRQGMTALATKIRRWKEMGFPKRNTNHGR